jgi:gluconolactonase
MRSKKTFLALLLFVFCCPALFGQGRRGGEAQDQKPPATDKVTPEIPGVVKAGTKIEVVKFGLRGADAGVGMPDGSLLVTTGGGVSRVDGDGNVTVLVENADNAAGLALDSKGRIFAAQYSKKVSILYPKGSEMLLADSYEGKSFIRPNDIVVDKKGGVYFTDCYQVGAKKSLEDLPQAVYYIPAGGKLMRVADDINRPNGITMSPDQKTLYVNDWDGEYLVTYDIQPDGTLKNRKNWGKFDLKQQTEKGLVSGADGLCSDNHGRMFSTTPAGVQVFSADGEHLGNIEMPYDMPPQNCGFAGPDKKDLFVVGRGAVIRIHTMTEGPKDRAK